MPQAGGKIVIRGIDSDPQCPWSRKNRLEGNRSGFSMPVEGKKRGPRESIKTPNARRKKKQT